MKNTGVIAILLLSASVLGNAQTGKVGVNTENPKETLDVQGTARVGELPFVNENTYNGAETKATAFKPAGFVAYNTDGVLGKLNSPAIVIHGTNMADDVNSMILQTSTYGSGINQYDYIGSPVKTISFTLETRSLVNFSMNVSVNNIRYRGGNGDTDVITDGAAKRVGMLASLKKEGEQNGRYIMKDTLLYTHGQIPQGQLNSAFTVQGTFYLNGATQLMLDAGKYEFVVNGTLFSTQTTGLYGEFGAAGDDYINITALPVEN